MKVDVHITDLTTGETRVYPDDYEWGSDDAVCYQYGDGNYSCDCNRELFFLRASGGVADPDDSDCGDERYAVEARERGTERVVYRDGDRSRPPK